MSLTGALYSGVTGLKANAQGMGIISDNISNSNTVGYKAATSSFETLVTSSPTNTSYTPGGVLPHPITHVDAQGLLQSSTSATDVAIQGNGFFVVANAVNTATNTVSATADYSYTRAGQFTIDKEGFLINTSGQYLLGASVSNLTAASSVATLVPVGVGTITGSAKATSTLTVGANLPAVVSTNTPISFYGGTTAATVAAGTAQNAIIYTSNGTAMRSGIELVNTSATVTSPTAYDVYVTSAAQWDPTTAALAGTTTVTPSSAFPVKIGSFAYANGSWSYTQGSTVNFSDGSTYAPTLTGSALSTTITAASTVAQAVDPHAVTATVYDSLGVAENLTLEFSRNQFVSQRTWTVAVTGLTIASTGATATTTTLPVLASSGAAFTTQTSATTASNIKFATDASLSSTFTWGASLPLTTGASNFGTGFTLDLGTLGTKSGLSGYDDKFAVSFLSQDGIRYGSRTGVSFDKDGFVSAVFDNGQTQQLFKLPLATFANVNRLEPVTGNLYRQSDQSGDPTLNFPSNGGAGAISPSTLESSTTDLSTEFTNMIVIQRSYSANAKTITTSDEMLQELLNIKR